MGLLIGFGRGGVGIWRVWDLGLQSGLGVRVRKTKAAVVENYCCGCFWGELGQGLSVMVNILVEI